MAFKKNYSYQELRKKCVFTLKQSRPPLMKRQVHMKLLFHTSTLTLTVKQLSLSTASGIHLNIVSLKIVILGIESRVVFPSFWLSSCVHFPTLLITILRSSAVLIVAMSNINI